MDFPYEPIALVEQSSVLDETPLQFQLAQNNKCTFYNNVWRVVTVGVNVFDV